MFDGVEVNTATHEVRVELAAADEYTPTARLRIEQPAKVEGIGTYHPTEKFNNAADGSSRSR